MSSSQLIGRDPDTGKDWRQEKKGATKDEVVGWHQQLNGHEFEHVQEMNSRRWWRIGKPGMLLSVGLQRVRYDLATQQQLPRCAPKHLCKWTLSSLLQFWLSSPEFTGPQGLDLPPWYLFIVPRIWQKTLDGKYYFFSIWKKILIVVKCT